MTAPAIVTVAAGLAAAARAAAHDVIELGRVDALERRSAMLTCLDREHRLTYLLADVFDLSNADAAAMCEVTCPGLGVIQPLPASLDRSLDHAAECLELPGHQRRIRDGIGALRDRVHLQLNRDESRHALTPTTRRLRQGCRNLVDNERHGGNAAKRCT